MSEIVELRSSGPRAGLPDGGPPPLSEPARPRGRAGRLIYRAARAETLIAIWAVALTALTGGVANWLEDVYLEHHSYFFDPVGLYAHNAELALRVADQGRWPVAVQEWLANPRHPLRTVPLVLLAPQWLAERWGHMATALPMLASLLFVAGVSLYRRTGHVPYALACMSFFCAVSGMLSPRLGLASYWLDLHASCLFAAAGFCLLNSAGGRDLRWLAAFAFFAAATALSRYVAGGYLAVASLPVLALFLLLRWREEHSFIRAVVIPGALIGAIVAVLAGYFVAAHFRLNIDFYSLYGWALGHSVWEAAAWTLRDVQTFVGARSVLLLAGFCLVNLVWFVQPLREWRWREQAALLWLALSHALFVVFVLRVVGQVITPAYSWALLFFLALAPAPWRRLPFRPMASFRLAVASFGLGRQRPLGWPSSVAAALVFASALAVGGRNVMRFHQEGQNPSPAAQDDKLLDVALAQLLAAQGERLVWMAYFDTRAAIVTTEAYYRYGNYAAFATRAGGKTLFSVHEFAWAVDYPGLSPVEVSLTIYDELCRWVDLVVTFRDPAAADSRFDNEYTRTLVRFVSASLASDPRWAPVFVLESAKYGTLVGYRNLSPQPGGYDWLMRHYGQSFP